jgi:hypothetical protein
MSVPSSAPRQSFRPIGVALGVGAVGGALYAGAQDAGHLSLGYVLWGAILAAGLLGLLRLTRGVVRGFRQTR